MTWRGCKNITQLLKLLKFCNQRSSYLPVSFKHIAASMRCCWTGHSSSQYRGNHGSPGGDSSLLSGSIIQILNPLKKCRENGENAILEQVSTIIDLTRNHYCAKTQVSMHVFFSSGICNQQQEAESWKATSGQKYKLYIHITATHRPPHFPSHLLSCPTPVLQGWFWPIWTLNISRAYFHTMPSTSLFRWKVVL